MGDPLLVEVERLLKEHVEHVERLLRAHGERVAGALNVTNDTAKTLADAVLENTQLMRMLAENQRADRLVDHHHFDEAARELAQAAAQIKTIARHAENAAKSAYDAAVIVEAMQGQISTPIQEAADAAEAAEDAATETAQVAKETAALARHLTGQFETLKNESEGKRRFDMRALKEFFVGFMAAFSNMPTVGKVLFTILFVSFFLGAVTIYVFHAMIVK